MTHCHNCGHSGSFVLLVDLALSIPADPSGSADSADSTDSTVSPDPADPDASGSAGRSVKEAVSLAVQCPACDSTDVGVSAATLLARYASNTSS
ncbi:hypothetical protein NGM07_06245 [Halorussus vallis]|uniref:hypothetical protein n=1 Tax=Halorussus vallis TaxID=2953749 RepID=UPI00209ED639|nr:hypothetical protein [Halorussus vallis]USZ76926.1 hypothetical protein NGM07_06245 [Halorussus vallis]